jgi:DNA-binding transcriptional regulator YiaG
MTTLRARVLFVKQLTLFDSYVVSCCLEFNLMAFKLQKDQLKAVQSAGSRKELTLDEIESLIGLMRKGNPGSLAQARNILGIETGELATMIGVAGDTLNAWEMESETPSQKYLITWRLKLGDFIESIIAAYLRTDDPELIHQFWEIMWRLSDI